MDTPCSHFSHPFARITMVPSSHCTIYLFLTSRSNRSHYSLFLYLVLLLVLSTPNSGYAQPLVQVVPPSVLTSHNTRIVPIEGINTSKLEYAPSITGDGTTLFFVSDQSGSIPQKTSQNAATAMRHTEGPALRSRNSMVTHSHDVWVARKKSPYDSTFFSNTNADTLQAYGMRSINTPMNEGAVSISADGTVMFLVVCNRDGYGDCDICMSTRTSDTTWGPIINLGEAVNGKYWDSQPCIAPDFSRLYFTSNRPGGVPVENSQNQPEPSIDIWYSDYDPVLQRFKPAVNAGETINTAGQEFSPFICADNRTLVFSSNAHIPNIGKMDFYYSIRYERGQWSTPTHIDTPINSDDDDAFLSVAASGDIMYFSSKRTDIANQGSYDIFMAVDDNALHRSGVITWKNPARTLTIRIYTEGKTLVRELAVNAKNRQSSAQTPRETAPYSILWDATNQQGMKVLPGTYLYDIIVQGKKVEHSTLVIE